MEGLSDNRYFKAVGELLLEAGEFDINIIPIEDAEPEMKKRIEKGVLLYKKNELFLRRIKTELFSELENISRLMKEYNGFINKYSIHMDAYLLRVKASFMADFYMWVEKIFRIIVEELNGGAPRGEGWHKRLLHAMTMEVKGVKPIVISNGLYKDLLKFLGFRHVVRQAYGFQLDEKKLKELEGIFEKTRKNFSKEIKSFCRFLEGKS